MPFRKSISFLFLSLCVLCATYSVPGFFCAASIAAQPGHAFTANDLNAAEMKLLQRTYENDPVAKRLQRLELLTFGATQYGSNASRWHNLQQYLQNKNGKNNSGEVGGNKSASVASSLNELEKYVFKKTAPNENNNQRLSKLETKLFGKASASMPVEQRIARLQRTLGIASDQPLVTEIPFGFQTRPRSPFNNMPYTQPGIPGMQIMPGMPNAPGMRMFPGMQPSPFGFGDDSDPELNQMESQMSQAFREMQRLMELQQEQQRQQGRGLPLPKQSPRRGAPQAIPQPNIAPGDKVPAYNDPNFI